MPAPGLEWDTCRVEVKKHSWKSLTHWETHRHTTGTLAKTYLLRPDTLRRPKEGFKWCLSVFFIVLFLSCYYVLGWFYLSLAINFNLQFGFLTFRLTSVMITCSFFLMPVVCKKTLFCSYLMWLNIHFTLSLNAFVLKWNSNSHSYPLFILFDKTRLSVCQNLPVTNFDTETLLLVILHVSVAYCKCHVKWAVRSCLSDVH